MNFVDIIEKKKNRLELSEEEINYWIEEYCKDNIPDYQVSALLMAITINGMSDLETFYLTKAMTNSGDTLDFEGIEGIKVDKHSTGGVGDKTSIALMPILATCGVKVAKMSGRGLGYCGGTVDKLESIPGMNVFLSKEDLTKQVNEIGIAMMGQTSNLCPADKKIYALRDVTSTVGSNPLIVSSIMSKKLACNDDVIVLDVKYGSGAFMPTVEDATKLAESMISIGKYFGKNICACISSMEEVLGRAVGNALEVKEAIDTLHGKGPEDFTELVLESGSLLLSQAGLYSKEEALKKMKENIDNGKAAELLKTMIRYQGGDERVVDDTSLLPEAEYITEIRAERDGYIVKMPASMIGLMSMELGAGRVNKDDIIDPSVGIVLNKKVGSYVKKGEVIAFIHHNRELSEAFMEKAHKMAKIQDEKVNPVELIEKIVY
ncbi:MAG: thymidine phosphorylase [Erysipelotrichaceae bacterium]|nr:thymidine phosphorylase [Erysipelotrichaceae bacterium]